MATSGVGGGMHNGGVELMQDFSMDNCYIILTFKPSKYFTYSKAKIKLKDRQYLKP